MSTTSILMLALTPIWLPLLIATFIIAGIAAGVWCSIFIAIGLVSMCYEVNE